MRVERSVGAIRVAVTFLGFSLPAAAATAQVRDSTQAVRDSLRVVQDSLRADSAAQAADAAVGLPAGPSRAFPAPDSIITELLRRPGYHNTRYAADSLTFQALVRQIDLWGAALVERDGSTLEADSIRYMQDACFLDATGDPKLFSEGTAVVGEEMDYDTCLHRGVVTDAITAFTQLGVKWYMRGDLSVDSASTRMYAGEGSITSSDLPVPDYHFAVGRTKYVSKNIMVARPVILYVRDVPVMWLPFIFQDMREGRRSGILVPRFGINDIVRPNEGYRRHITNIGYYFAINDYLDLQASLDWFASTSVAINTQLRYNWLDRFMTGSLGASRVFESSEDGATGRQTTRLNWNHQQQFNQRTRLSAAVDFATSTRVLRENSVDPFLQTGNLRSTINFSKQLDWGTITLGGSRTQQISDESVSQRFPDVRLTPVPISIGSDITWSPTFSFVVAQQFNQAAGTIVLPPVDGIPQEDSLFTDTRTTTLHFGTPIRFGRWNLRNDFRVTDVFADRRTVLAVVDPNDSTKTVDRLYGERFSTEINWETGINLPMLFPATWKFQPSVGVRNKTSGPFMLRNEFTGGEFVQQGKRLSFAASMSPAIFGFLPGFGPVERIRHSFSPQFSWTYAPSAEVSERFMRALQPGNPNPRLTSPALHSVGLLGISQTFEGKFASDDTSGTGDAQKIKLLSIQTSGLQYDFEQAKEPGRNGWRTSSISNTLTSDLLRGFNLRFTHDLWDGPVGFDSAAFSPFLRSIATSFTISGATFARLARAVFGGEPLEAPGPDELAGVADSLDEEFFAPVPVMAAGRAFQSIESIAGRGQRGRGFTASIRFNDRRSRSDEQTQTFGTPTNNRTFGATMSFSPTRNWSLQWTTDYNLTTKEFGSNALRFERDLQRWRATFAFVQAPNGNFAFNFFVQLIDLTEIKFNYDQRTVNR
ncbi:MAG: putative LPS assembly protein LptD [Gemmatimonadetes bacterium]|nr:putative LPS assembly protein LptD [Gemmatimonadota bacterium]